MMGAFHLRFPVMFLILFPVQQRGMVEIIAND